jgi:hypothetical protein
MTSTNFWTRFGLQEKDRQTCLNAVRARYEGYVVDDFEEQGYCSCTLLVTPLDDVESNATSIDSTELEKNESYGNDALIVQLRPAPHALDLDFVHAASTTYPTLAPVVRPLNLGLSGGLHAYEMGRLSGTPLIHLLCRERTLNAETRAKLDRLITSFASLIGQSWHSLSEPPFVPRATRADSPMDSAPDKLSQLPGKVGSTIVHRLNKLAAQLPDAHLRERAKNTLHAVQRMTGYPVVLNHGDLIPSNVLVDEATWEITGLVDWAEAEYLPFGTCLYGLEHLLGYMTSASPDTAPTFVCFDDATRLRQLFWTCLSNAVPELGHRKEEVKAMRDLGVLLWHGIAWDDGAINRVVNEVDDVEELAKLRAFLGAS